MSGKKTKLTQKKTTAGGTKKPQRNGNGSGGGPVTTDPRFAHVHRDPRFMRPRKQDTKVTIDKRFAQMLKKDFSDAPKVDRYGRKLQSQNTESELKRFYQIGNEDEDEEATDDDEDKTLEQLEKELEEDESNEEEEEEEGGTVYDPARGEGVISGSEDESEEESEDDVAANEDEVDPQEAIPMGDESRRLAVVNLDWDHVRAVDLFKIFNGFKPDGSVIRSVRVYPSEFGKERLAREEQEGPPREIFKAGRRKGGKVTNADTDDEDDEEEVTAKTIVKADEGEEFDMDALRKYQLDRLRYYYAVVECDTVATARVVYQACDGAEFERSANFFDMRYVPDGMDFEDEPRDEAHHAPENYRPVDFVTNALQHSHVKLTWDEDDQDRVQMTRRKFTKEDLKEMDFRAYLASSEEDDSGDEDTEEMRRKYKGLLAGAEGGGFGKNREEDEGAEMEITFTPGLSEAAAEAVERKRKGGEMQEDVTTIEKYVRKLKEKKKAKKLAKKDGAEDEEDGEEGSHALFSDDDVSIDASDPFFADAKESSVATPAKAQSKFASKRAQKKQKSRQHRALDSHQHAELDLLMADSTGAGDGFDMREVLRREKLRGKKGKKARRAGEEEDDFEINVTDPRFEAVMDSHHFAIDPTNPQYKKTKAMERLQAERRKRQAEGGGQKRKVEVEALSTKKQGPFQDPSLSLLVDSVKRKTAMATMSQEGKRKKAKI